LWRIWISQGRHGRDKRKTSVTNTGYGKKAWAHVDGRSKGGKKRAKEGREEGERAILVASNYSFKGRRDCRRNITTGTKGNEEEPEGGEITETRRKKASSARLLDGTIRETRAEENAPKGGTFNIR